MCAWPIHDWTAVIDARPIASEPNVCRRSWKRRRRIPARFTAASKRRRSEGLDLFDLAASERSCLASSLGRTQCVFSGLGLAPLVLIFLAAAVAVWMAGIQLSHSTDALDRRLGLGEALGGVILLAVATNLPEIAITASAALGHDLGIAIGNILGGIAIQTVVLVALDVAMGPESALTTRAASLVLGLEGLLVIVVLAISVMGAQLPAHPHGRLEPAALLIALCWLVGVWLVNRARRGLPWHDSSGTAPGGQEKARGHSKAVHAKKMSLARAAAVFALAGGVTLVAGVLLERSGERIASHVGLSGVVFGATVLAAATALPELSTGIESVRLGDYQLAVSDIFGGNAFLPVLFLLANLLSGSAVLPQAQPTDIYLTALGIVLTVVYGWGLITRPYRQLLHMGMDSLTVLVLYAAGIAGLIAVSNH
jgi:cation:H+ antiporter